MKNRRECCVTWLTTFPDERDEFGPFREDEVRGAIAGAQGVGVAGEERGLESGRGGGEDVVQGIVPDEERLVRE